ncbi:MAG TPA: low molecular weight protein tyrosine phosphatase family protein [Polyangiaceae bacterium]|nr:low molecular weight protein tyrosine phosphatase family protein [Polyangiaceae bacterium]
MRHILFVCGKNRLRSPTAEAVFASWPGVEVASAGLSRDADTPVTPELLAWADSVFVMERAHGKRLSSLFQAHLRDKRVVCLGIRDEYEFMEPALVALLLARVTPHLPSR